MILINTVLSENTGSYIDPFTHFKAQLLPPALSFRLKFVFGPCALQALDLVDQRSVTCLCSPSGRKVFQVCPLIHFFMRLLSPSRSRCNKIERTTHFWMESRIIRDTTQVTWRHIYPISKPSLSKTNCSKIATVLVALILLPALEPPAGAAFSLRASLFGRRKRSAGCYRFVTSNWDFRAAVTLVLVHRLHSLNV